MQQGKEFYNKSEYMTALERFDFAYEFAKTDAEKTDAKSWKNKSREKIKQQQSDLKKALMISRYEKVQILNLRIKAEAALEKAEQMQRKVETAMFDRAVKEQYKEWKGYDKYDWKEGSNEDTKKGLEILNKIDTLNLAENALLRLPEEITDCKNLKSINLLGNSGLSLADWDSCFQILHNLPLTEIKVSIYDLDDLSSQYWQMLTGIELLQLRQYPFGEIPKNILAQKQLSLLNINGTKYTQNQLKKIPFEIGEMNNLKTLSLAYCNIDSIPTEIEKLNHLTSLDLNSNKLSVFPMEISKLTSLTDLDLSDNSLQNIPIEIGKLTNLTELYLSNNQLTFLPPEFGNLSKLTTLFLCDNRLETLPNEIKQLTNLKYLDLVGNNFSEAEKQKIETWLPNCKINW
jgi:Leucine-rich repeat (LRR) protein